MTNWKAFPKTELHLHLEGAAPVDFMIKQAAKKSVDLSHVIDGDRYKWADFNAFLKTYEAVMEALKTPEDFADLMEAVMEAQAAQGVKYTEITLGVILMAQNDKSRWLEMLTAISEASARVEAKHDIIANYTAVIVRHYDVDEAIKTAELVATNPHPRVTGFGMAGAEDFKRPADFVRAFEIAGAAGLGLTCHAGEWCDADAIRETIDSLGVTRLGHGVRAAEDASLLDELAERDIHAEICPGSNVSLGVFPDLASHSIHDFRRRGLSYSISTDDPPYFDTDLEREYRNLAAFGFDDAEFSRSNREAMRHAFCDEDTRAKLIQFWSEDAQHH